jgi:dissimilatory sulfite reductase related protein
MDIIRVEGVELHIDGDGFLQDPQLWNEAVAAEIARLDGITELGPKHWEMIRFIRGFWEESDMAPTVRNLCKQSGLKLQEIYGLFPKGPARGACRIAGLPKPDGCV